MAVVTISDSILTDIADAIRSKNGTENTYKPAQMPDAIEAISGGGSTPVINSLSVTENGTYTAPTGVDGYSPITVNVSGGGGSGGFSLLETITLDADSRTIDIDLSDYQDYDLFFVIGDVELSASDWLYYVRNGTSASGGTYDTSMLTHKGLMAIQAKTLVGGSSLYSATVNNQAMSSNNATTAMTNLYIYTYTATKYMLAGSTFKIYGANYSDL